MDLFAHSLPMRFRIDTSAFRNAIEIASHATTVSSLTPILENILIDARYKKLILVGNNLEIAIECALTENVDIESEGKFTISSRFITSYLSLVQEKEIIVQQEGDGSLRFETKSGETKFKGTPADKFPVIPQVNPTTSVKILS
jgi:DNA polymerase-3 subunit beta